MSKYEKIKHLAAHEFNTLLINKSSHLRQTLTFMLFNKY